VTLQSSGAVTSAWSLILLPTSVSDLN
jgi:hypothetical protein